MNEENLTTGTKMVINERIEQIKKHNHSIKDDTKFEKGELMYMAQYLIFSNKENLPQCKTWSNDYIAGLHRKSRIEQLSIAAAFLIAEIDRRIYLNENEKLNQ